MRKHEPNKTLKFKPRLANPPELVRLAKFQAKESFQGPWDQTRTWIYTDHATLDEISAVMFPGPGEGNYVRAVYEVGQLYPLLDFTRPELSRCFEPRLLTGNVAPRDATIWFVQKMSDLDPEGLVKWMDANPGAFAPLWTDTTLAVNPRHLADVAAALMFSDSESVRQAGLRFLMKVIPEDKRGFVIGNRGLEGLAYALARSTDGVEANGMIDAVEAYSTKDATFGLRNVGKALPEAVRARAAKVLEGIGG